jgi:peptidoglycan/LPS O-acetylase OafA/YrhL
MDEIKKQDNSYVIQLDGLRFFAILSVMMGHWLQWQINKPIVQGFPFGNGVILFFVLSGYLITDILLRNKIKVVEISIPKSSLLKSFYARRVLRIFPLYFVTIFFLYFIHYKNTREIFPWLVTFSSNIYQSIHVVFVGDFNHFWSLAVEEQFYLFWPWLIVLMPTKYSEKIIVGLIGLSVLTKIYLLIYFPGNWMANSYFTLSCMHALGIGALISYWNIYRKNIISYFSKFSWVFTSVVVYFSIHYFNFFYKVNWFHAIFDDVLFALMSAFIINYASQNKFTGILKYILENKFVVYSGKISYGIYILHLFMPDLFWGYLSRKIGLDITNKYTAFVALYLLTFLVAHVSWKLMESPINNLKRYFPYLKKEER